MNHESYRIIKCPVCCDSDVKNGKSVSEIGQLIQCSNCSHVFSLLIGGKQDSDNSNEHFENSNYVDWRKKNLSRLKKDASAKVNFVLNNIPDMSSTVLEIGCSSGEVLNEMALKEWNVTGVDLSNRAIDVAKEAYPDIPVTLGTESILLKNDSKASYDLIIGFHVIEHIYDIEQFLSNVSKLCNPGGHVCFYVPYWDSASRKVMNDEWPDFMPEHVHFFTKNSMQKWLSSAGFELIREETKSKSWHWIGGIKRKISIVSSGKRDKKTRGNQQRRMPSNLSMAILDIADIALFPLLKLESFFGLGSELCVVAKKMGQ